MLDLKPYLLSRQKLVNNALDKIFDGLSNSGRLIQAMRYSLMAGGKRIRPVLCLAACEAVNGYFQDALLPACTLEMIHTYSLIHDDLPAIDNDNLRRGKPTCHIRFDEATAILAGDALLTLAFEILSSKNLFSDNRETEDSASTRLEVIRSISSATGCEGMIEGQMLDIISEKQPPGIKELEKMHSKKTGALIEASVYTGAIIGGGTEKQIKQLQNYAKNIGLAFQVTDDILNVEGDPRIMGKAAGTDEIRNKGTYPSLIGLPESKKLAKKLINGAIEALGGFDQDADPLRAIASYIIHRTE